jgi:hypothetical protein
MVLCGRKTIEPSMVSFLTTTLGVGCIAILLLLASLQVKSSGDQGKHEKIRQEVRETGGTQVWFLI